MEVSRLAHRPEVALLLCCARTNLSSENVEQMRGLLHSEMDWTYLLRMAGGHGLIPLLYFNLKNNFPDLVPAPITDRLHVQFLANAGRNVFLAEELLKILALFETNAIPAIPHKGPVLAVSLYGDLTLRTFGDLDIIVRKQDVHRAKALLFAQGYRLDLSLTWDQEIAFLNSDLEGWFVRQDGKVMVEVQWGERKDFPLTPDFEPFWKRLGKYSFQGTMVLTFSPEDLLLLLCLHGAEHCWERLNWVCDLAEFVRVHEGIDWSGLIDRAEVLGCRRVLLLGLFLAHDLLATPLPGEILKTIQDDSSIQALAVQVYERLYHYENGPAATLQRSLFNLKVTERLQDRIRYCLRLAFHPGVVDWQALPLPRSLFFLYNVIHPLRVAGKYARQYLKHLFYT